MVDDQRASARGERHVRSASVGRSSTPPTVRRSTARPRSRRREATRERVLDAARDVFAERGVFGGSVEDICARAGFTRGAFYSNFVDKDDVLRAVIDREHTRLLAHLDGSLELVGVSAEDAPDADPVALMARIADRLLRSVPSDRQFSLISDELEIHAVRDADVARTFAAADRRFRARIAGLLERGLASSAASSSSGWTMPPTP